MGGFRILPSNSIVNPLSNQPQPAMAPYPVQIVQCRTVTAAASRLATDGRQRASLLHLLLQTAKRCWRLHIAFGPGPRARGRDDCCCSACLFLLLLERSPPAASPHATRPGRRRVAWTDTSITSRPASTACQRLPEQQRSAHHCACGVPVRRASRQTRRRPGANGRVRPAGHLAATVRTPTPACSNSCSDPASCYGGRDCEQDARPTPTVLRRGGPCTVAQPARRQARAIIVVVVHGGAGLPGLAVDPVVVAEPQLARVAGQRSNGPRLWGSDQC